jgi:hypothetical protein
MLISCKLQAPRPHNPWFRWSPSAASARAEPGALALVGCISGLGRRLPSTLRLMEVNELKRHQDGASNEAQQRVHLDSGVRRGRFCEMAE